MALSIDFAGRHVFVFGGTTGINFGVAEAFAKHGANLTVVSRKQENVDNAVAALRLHGGDPVGATGDVRDMEAVDRALQAGCARHGAIDVLVSGAAGNFLSAANDLSSNGFRAVVDIDLIGTFHVMRATFPRLTKPGASVINITAPQSFVPMRYQAHVCAAKAGVDQMTRVLALEWGVDGVRVNSISPGPIAGTEGMRRLSTPEAEKAMLEAIPLRRMGSREDIAWLAMFLSSPYASYISGAVIPCDGGGAMESVKPMIEAAGKIDAAQKATAQARVD
ncbi:SDR family oxidoreductase [Roseiarcus sp.]|uniref:SDR family oxidoreductase n=1 Tax=Roseiarcus sp. TaxID=1969460 RepID=UPI003F9ADE67